jgi:D-arabinose 1-dehydrogenase-like Zn-dependent alcohol dehydrogenase
MEKMKALVFRGVNDIHIDEVPRSHAGVGEAVRVTLTTICSTDLRIVRGEYIVKPGLIIGTNQYDRRAWPRRHRCLGR